MCWQGTGVGSADVGAKGFLKVNFTLIFSLTVNHYSSCAFECLKCLLQFGSIY